MITHRFFGFLFLVLASSLLGQANSSLPPDYYAEPDNLPFDEDVIEKGTEAGWHWTEFRFTSLIYQGEPIRIRALFAIPDSASATNKVPLILATHGKFGFVRPMTPEGKADPRYWSAVTDFVKAGYAVMFFEWEPTFAIKAGASPPEHPRFSTYGKLDYSKDWRLPGNDFKDSLYYQVVMAGKRALTWALQQPEIDSSKVGVWGASFGGIFSSLLAAVDPRITAANPVVYTARFGLNEESYNRLPKEWTDAQVADFQARFDSEFLLKKRSVPILYSVSTNDKPFSILKANEGFAAMQEPKHFLIAPNYGHNFWNFPQTIRFFDFALRGKGERPKIGGLDVKKGSPGITASIPTNAQTVEFYYTPEIPQEGTIERERNQPFSWTWIKVEGRPEPDGTFRADWTLPENPAQSINRIHVFALVKSSGGVMESSPILTLPIAAPPQS